MATGRATLLGILMVYTGNLFAGGAVLVTSKKCEFQELSQYPKLHQAYTVDYVKDATLELARKDLSTYLEISRKHGKPNKETTEKAIEAARLLGSQSTLDIARDHFKERGQHSQNIEHNYTQLMSGLIDLWPHMETELAPLRSLVFSHLADFESQLSRRHILNHLLKHSEKHPQEIKEIVLQLLRLKNPENFFGGDVVFADQIKSLLHTLRLEPQTVQWTAKEVAEVKTWFSKKIQFYLVPTRGTGEIRTENLETALIYAQARVNLFSHLGHQPQSGLFTEQDRTGAYWTRDYLRNRMGMARVP